MEVIERLQPTNQRRCKYSFSNANLTADSVFECEIASNCDPSRYSRISLITRANPQLRWGRGWTRNSAWEDTPNLRSIERDGRIIATDVLCGLHHQYGRIEFSERTPPPSTQDARFIYRAFDAVL